MNPFNVDSMAGPLGLAHLSDLWDRVTSVGELVDGAPITLDIARVQRVFDVTLGGDRTLNLVGSDADGNVVALGDAALADIDGKQILLRIKQDGIGTRLLTAGTGFHFGTDLASVTLTTTAGKTDYIGLIYNHGASRCDVIASAKGY